MEKKAPSTMKEALIAELLSDLNETLEKAEAVIASAEKVDATLQGSTKALIVAGEKYKGVINSFTDETKKALSSHIKEETRANLENSVIELKTANKELLDSAIKDTKKAFPLTPLIIGLLVFMIGLNGLSIYLSIR
jgi:hypothetical protein